MLICQNITFLIFKQAKVAFVLEKKKVSGMMNIYCGCEIGVLFHLKKSTMF